MKINPDVGDIFGFRYEDFELVGYQAHPSIPAPRCYLWTSNLQANEAATGTRGCAGGLAEGLGEITWISGIDWQTNTGQHQRGRYHGKWVNRDNDGSLWEGSYVDGKRHGRWVWHLTQV